MKCGICEIGCHIEENGYGRCRMGLGRMHIANTLHPEIFEFDMEKEADAFYTEFFHQPFNQKTANRSFYRVAR